jgi:hypothetical protein
LAIQLCTIERSPRSPMELLLEVPAKEVFQRHVQRVQPTFNSSEGRKRKYCAWIRVIPSQANFPVMISHNITPNLIDKSEITNEPLTRKHRRFDSIPLLVIFRETNDLEFQPWKNFGLLEKPWCQSLRFWPLFLSGRSLTVRREEIFVRNYQNIGSFDISVENFHHVQITQSSTRIDCERKLFLPLKLLRLKKISKRRSHQF